MSNLFSNNIDEIAEACIDIYLNPEKYQKNKENIVKRLLELPNELLDYK